MNIRSLVRRALSKVRGILGLGLLGAGVGFLGAGVLGLVSLLMESGLSLDLSHWASILDRLAQGVVPWTLLGGFTGVGFGGLLATTSARRDLEGLSPWRSAFSGALVGALFIPVYYLVVGGWRSSLLPFIAVTGGLGALLSTSMVALAKRAHRLELSVFEEVCALIEDDSTVELGAREPDSRRFEGSLRDGVAGSS